MAKIMWQAEPETVPSYNHVIQHLINAGNTVFVDDTYDGHRRFVDNSYITKMKQEQFDLGVYTVHVDSPKACSFVQKMSPMRSVFIPHDIFITSLDGAKAATPPSSEYYALPFTDPQVRYCVKAGLKYIPCTWYKLGLPPSTFSSGFSALDTALLADSVLYKDHTFPHLSLFKQVVLKRFDTYNYAHNTTKDGRFSTGRTTRSDSLSKYGITNAPLELVGPAGTKAAASCSKFWFTRESSLYTEALFEGCIPILYNIERLPGFEATAKDKPYIGTETQRDDIVSDVTLTLLCGRFPAITETNLEHKIRALQNSSSLFEQTLNTLLGFWEIKEPTKLVEHAITEILAYSK